MLCTNIRVDTELLQSSFFWVEHDIAELVSSYLAMRVFFGVDIIATGNGLTTVVVGMD